MEKVQGQKYVRLEGIRVVAWNNNYRGGAVILCKDNWRYYDSQRNEVLNCTWGIPEKYEDAAIMNSATVSTGDLIMHNERFYFVEKALAKCIIAFCAESGQRRIIPPTKTKDGWVFYKIIPWVTILWHYQEETLLKSAANSRDRIAYSFQYGSAIKCGERWRIYEKETQKVADLQGVCLFSERCYNNRLEIMRLMEAVRVNKPILYNELDSCVAPIASPKEGAVIVYDEEYYFAVGKVDNGIKALNADTGELRIIPPTRTIQGDRYWQYITLEELSKNPESGEFDYRCLMKAQYILSGVLLRDQHRELPL